MTLITEKDARCRQIEALIAAGQGVCETCREIGISEKTFYRWRQQNSDKVRKSSAT